MQKNMHEVGKAAEHLVCADLILAGHRAFIADAGCPYDVVLDIDGRIYRVQVKSTRTMRNTVASNRKPRFAYLFNPRRGRFGRKRLGMDTCDLAAFVALDIRCIAYLPVSAVSMTVSMFAPGHQTISARSIDKCSLSAALAAL